MSESLGDAGGVDFEQSVQEALDALPAELRQAVENLDRRLLSTATSPSIGRSWGAGLRAGRHSHLFD
jgi:hypothetical protein